MTPSSRNINELWQVEKLNWELKAVDGCITRGATNDSCPTVVVVTLQAKSSMTYPQTQQYVYVPSLELTAEQKIRAYETLKEKVEEFFDNPKVLPQLP